MKEYITLETKIKGVLRTIGLEDEETILTLMIDDISILSISKNTGTMYKYNCLCNIVAVDDKGKIREEQ